MGSCESTVYGPIKSWRFGQSVGIDPLFVTSICSFNCIYCQLGHIQNHTTNIAEYVSTQKIVEDFQLFLNKSLPYDVITFSGNGEPTLALNLEQIARQIKNLSIEKPLIILTNGSNLINPDVRRKLQVFDRVIIKLDTTEDDIFRRTNRPAQGISLSNILEGIKSLRQEYNGKMEIQTMLMNPADLDIEKYVKYMLELRPNLIQLNTPKRDYPLEWHRENRGNHEKISYTQTRQLKKIDKTTAEQLQKIISEKTQIPVLSVYN